jgi:hypothetical protein
VAETITRKQLREDVSALLRLRWRGTVSAVSAAAPHYVDVPDLGFLIPQSAAPIANYLAKDDLSAVRRVTDYDASLARVYFAGSTQPFAVNDVVHVYLILTPADWNLAIDQALRNLFVTVFYSIAPPTLSETKTDYTLPTWVSSREQVQKVVIRTAPTGQPVVEREHPAWSVNVDGNAATLLLHTPLKVDANTSLVVHLRKPYDKLASDAATTTCPEPLARAAVKVEALRMVWHLMGEEEAKRLFGSELQIAMAELAEAKARFMPKLLPQPLVSPQRFLGPEFAFPPTWGRW